MNRYQFAEIIFSVITLYWFYRGLTLLAQAMQDQQRIVWYKHFNLTRGMYCLLLGLAGMIVCAMQITNASMPLGNTGWFIFMGIVELPMVVFGILSLKWHK
ncbi:hypothetical protein ccbrp13_69190 [Ktedonobacteria bacterium brp13]|nr:hypothetical protein ccbrp13_69190 [Ktedonobacteria bacterium brp13]